MANFTKHPFAFLAHRQENVPSHWTFFHFWQLQPNDYGNTRQIVTRYFEAVEKEGITGLFNASVYKVGMLTVAVLRLWDVSQVTGSTQSGAEPCGLLCIVVFCSHFFEATVPALLIRLTLIKQPNYYSSTSISYMNTNPALWRNNVGIVHSVFIFQM